MTDEVETITPEVIAKVDRCLTCNELLHYGGRGPRPKYCDEHKPGKPAPKRLDTPAGRGNTGKLNANKATGLVSKLLIILTIVLADVKIKRAGFTDPNGTLAEELTLTDDEAMAIAHPVARWATKSDLGSRIVSPLVDNEDLVDAAVALYDYSRRVSQLLNAQKEVRVNVARQSIPKAESGNSRNGAGPVDAVAANNWATIL